MPFVRNQLISLLQMIKVTGSTLVHVGNMLGLMQSCSMLGKMDGPTFPKSISFTVPHNPGREQSHTIHFHADDSGKPDSGAEPEKRTVQSVFPEIVEWFEDLKKHCDKLSLRLSSIQLQRVIEDLKNGDVQLEVFGKKAGELVERIEDELSEIKLLKLEGHSELYNTLFPFGKDVGEKLPSAAEDAQEAATCLSLERWTACVFHLMRVVEIGVQKFGDKIGVKLTDEKNWQNILDEVNKSIRSMDQKADQTKKYASLAAHLYNVKIAWRNEVMHPKATYTPQEADEIYKNVATFMGHLVQVV